MRRRTLGSPWGLWYFIDATFPPEQRAFLHRQKTYVQVVHLCMCVLPQGINQRDDPQPQCYSQKQTLVFDPPDRDSRAKGYSSKESIPYGDKNDAMAADFITVQPSMRTPRRFPGQGYSFRGDGAKPLALPACKSDIR